MAWAAKRPVIEPLTVFFTGPLTAQFYLLLFIGPLIIFEIPSSLINSTFDALIRKRQNSFLSRCNKTSNNYIESLTSYFCQNIFITLSQCMFSSICS